MALIPLKQTVLIEKPASRNDWGQVTFGETIEMKCRADEKVEYVKNLASTTLNEEVVSTVQFIFDKLPNISYEDKIIYTNELDNTIEGNPVLIEPIRMPNGKPTLTTVYL